MQVNQHQFPGFLKPRMLSILLSQHVSIDIYVVVMADIEEKMEFNSRRILLFAAYVNYVIGLAFLTALPEIASEFDLIPLPGGHISLRSCGALVSAWGCGYWLLSRKLISAKVVVRVISTSKWLLAAVFGGGLMRGEFYWPIPILIFVDLVSLQVSLNCLKRLVLPVARHAIRI